jgi:hypothetical protein
MASLNVNTYSRPGAGPYGEVEAQQLARSAILHANALLLRSPRRQRLSAGIWLILIGMVLAAVNLGRGQVYSYTGINTDDYFSFGLFPVTFVFYLLGTVFYEARHAAEEPLRKSAGFNVRCVAFLAGLMILTVRGYLNGVLFRNYACDLISFGTVFMFLLLGRHDSFWHQMSRPLLYFNIAAFAFDMTGINKYRTDMITGRSFGESALSIERRGATISYAYSGVEMISSWPLAFFTSSLSKVRSRTWLLGTALFVSYLFLMIYFQKRAPTVRVVALGLMCWLGVPMLMGRLRVSRLLATLLIAVTAAIAGSLLLPAVRLSLEMLTSRFQTSDLSRSTEATWMAEWVLRNTGSILFGEGLGGGFVLPGQESQWSIEPLDVHGTLGRTSLHVGILYPFLKGGLCGMAFYYANFFALFLCGLSVRWRRDPFNAVSLGLMLVYFLFQFTEGSISTENSLESMMIGMCLGRSWVGPRRLTFEAAVSCPTTADALDGRTAIAAPGLPWARGSVRPSIA